MPNGIAFAFLLQTDKRCIKIIITNPKFITDSRPRKLFLQHLFIQIIKIERIRYSLPPFRFLSLCIKEDSLLAVTMLSPSVTVYFNSFLHFSSIKMHLSLIRVLVYGIEIRGYLAFC